jgi:hypothetical protein
VVTFKYFFMVHREKFLRERKMALLLPLLIGPFLCLGFYGLGGGKGKKEGNGGAVTKGLNMSLPAARFDGKKKALNKLGFYKQADQDSLRLMQSRKEDPFYNRAAPVVGTLIPPAGQGLGRGALDSGRWDLSRQGLSGLNPGRVSVNGQADELLHKLDALKGVLNRQRDSAGLRVASPGGRPWMKAPGQENFPPGVTGALPGHGLSLGSSERIPVGVSYGLQTRGAGDPDLDKLSGMLDKILRIQSPAGRQEADTVSPRRAERVTGLLTAPPSREAVGMLAAGGPGGPVVAGSAGDTNKTGWMVRVDGPDPGVGVTKEGVDPGSGFMELGGGQEAASAGDGLIGAMVARDQTLVSGESVEFRLAQEAVIGGALVPAGTLLSGKASLSEERLLVSVTAIRLGSRALPVSLEVVDMDGMAGIREPGSMNRDVSKESVGEAVGSLGVTSVDPGLGAQVASAGLQTARSLIGRKVRLVRVSLNAGYRVLLRNTKGNH